MEINKNKKSVKFQRDMLNFHDFIQVFVFATNHHLNRLKNSPVIQLKGTHAAYFKTDIKQTDSDHIMTCAERLSLQLHV